MDHVEDAEGVNPQQTRDASPARGRRQAGDFRVVWETGESRGECRSQPLPRQPLVVLQPGEHPEYALAEISGGRSHLQTSTTQQPDTHAPRNLVSKRGACEALAGRELMRRRGLAEPGRDNGQAVPQQRNT